MSRFAGGPLNAVRLADGLEAYSQRGQLYVQEIKFMIRSARFDRLLAGVYLIDPNAEPER